jgi:four helix bundle protein
MKYERFEDLPVWQAAMELAERVFIFTASKWFRGKGDLADQMQRASISVGNNIAEGFERGTTQELLTFIYIARGSAGETRSALLLAERLLKSEDASLRAVVPESEMSHLKSQIPGLRSLAESVSRQLRGWADSLQNSPIRGQRYLNDQSRRVDDQTRRAAEFWSTLEREHARRLGLKQQGEGQDEDEK